MTQVTFEVATIADSLKKANQIAPSKGAAFDKAAGILIEIDPLDIEHAVTVKATNTELYYLEWVDAIDIQATEKSIWRLPSTLLSGVVGNMPIGSGKTVTFTQKENTVTIQSGRITCRMQLLDPKYYPIWEPFDTDDMKTVSHLATRIAQVAWACDKSMVPLTGVQITGAELVATDRYKLAKAECDVPVKESITVSLAACATLLKGTGDAQMKVDEPFLHLMPDATTQLSAIMYDQKYPGLTKVMSREQPNCIKISAQEMIEAIQRSSFLVKSERFPLLRMSFGEEEIRLVVTVPQKAAQREIIDIEGQALHDPIEIQMTPDNFIQALQNSPNDAVSIFYNPAALGKPLRIDGGSGYEAWVIPRRQPSDGGV